MKKIIAIVALIALMAASLGQSGFAALASGNAYADVPEAMPAQPEE